MRKIYLSEHLWNNKVIKAGLNIKTSLIGKLLRLIILSFIYRWYLSNLVIYTIATKYIYAYMIKDKLFHNKTIYNVAQQNMLFSNYYQVNILHIKKKKKKDRVY